ncbi:hypothetical protein MH117_20320 [Paenibacillus sp. ACRRX]|uniref:hypothetical protein n=1 Tax=unclassified Paenibacillus TaxID=185978 RepID=UPI001EF6F25D|nr:MULTISPECIES: hypothetical protein [unclassified Paenibacillus]MCG7409755.1 hypothetical protein [Paenibacillus sp. ACRRX]MDK8183168.1 hypothetical protein [Paenibacillus sp. UMB4589-SE434]
MSIVKRITPPLKDPQLKGKVVSKVTKKRFKAKQIPNLYFTRFTVLWVQNNGVTFNTAGFFARVFSGGRLLSTAAFDRHGVVRFNNIGVLTNVPLTIQVFNRVGILFRTRNVPRGVEAFAIIG